MRARLPLLAFLVVVPALAALAACADALGFPAPHLVTVVDTVSLYALDGTPLQTPSAFQLDGRRLFRTVQTAVFDFAFNLDSAKHALILPTGALHLGQASGLQRSTTPFDRITEASTGGRELTTALRVDTGTDALEASRSACPAGSAKAGPEGGGAAGRPRSEGEGGPAARRAGAAQVAGREDRGGRDGAARRRVGARGEGAVGAQPAAPRRPRRRR